MAKKPSKEDVAYDNEISRVSRLLLDLVIAENARVRDDRLMLLALGKTIAALVMEFSIRNQVGREAVMDWVYSYARSALYDFAAGWEARKK